MSIQPNINRIEVIDALRGFSLAGIVLVHVVEQYYAGPPPEVLMSTATQGLLDKVISGFIVFFLQGKFFALFSILFGLSFYIQMNRAAEKGVNFQGRFIWRIILLFIIGYFHSLFYRGDILTLYAIVAFALIPFHKISNRYVLIVAAILLLGAGRYVVFAINGDDSLFGIAVMDVNSSTNAHYFETVKNGSLWEVFKLNAGYGQLSKMDFQFGIFNRGYLTLGYFLVGLWLGRMRLFINLDEKKKRLKRVLLGSIGVFFIGGIISGIMFSNAGMTDDSGFNNWWAIFGLTGMDIANMALTSIILTGFLLLYTSGKVRKYLNYLAPYGRTALSNYVFQSVIGTFIFFGWGLGMIAEFSNTITFVIALIIIILQVALSKWWLKRYRFGPLEWLWRTATYLRLQPLNKR